MTKEQHVAHWTNTAKEDWATVEALLLGKRYMHSLFWAHFTEYVRNHLQNKS